MILTLLAKATHKVMKADAVSDTNLQKEANMDDHHEPKEGTSLNNNAKNRLWPSSPGSWSPSKPKKVKVIKLKLHDRNSLTNESQDRKAKCSIIMVSLQAQYQRLLGRCHAIFPSTLQHPSSKNAKKLSSGQHWMM